MRVTLHEPPRDADEVSAAIKDYLIYAVLDQRRQPSPAELVAELDRAIGVFARWDLVAVLKSLARNRALTAAKREYLACLLDGDELVKALRGESAPDRDASSTIDDVLRASAVYRSSAGFREMVDFMSRFQGYAPYNLMLIRVQNPSCSFFASANHWHQRFERSVNEDARPMLILAPGGPVMTVYDLDDTDGPSLPEELTRFATVEGRWDARWLARLVEGIGRLRIRVDFKPLSSTNAGFVTRTLGPEEDKFRIVIHRGLEDSSRFGVLCHEFAHMLLGHLGGDKERRWPSRSHLGREAIEIEAETTAYMVTRRLGLEGTSAEYMSRHLGHDATVPPGVSFDTIAKVAGKLENMVRTARKSPQRRRLGEGTEQGLERIE